MEVTSKVEVGELVKLCAVDNDLFGRTFFPEAIRKKSPPIHREMDELLDHPAFRFINLRCFRGSAKTTKLRVFIAKRIAYGISRSVLYIGASEGHAARSIQWLRGKIEPRKSEPGKPSVQSFYSGTFGLSPGKKWTDTEIEIVRGMDPHPVWVLGVGITGSIRGINFDDYRPDLIVLDDIVTDENAATFDQREKITDLVLGAVSGSLISAVEEPNAKLAMLQSPIHSDDVSARAEKAQSWKTAIFGCWTKETADLPVEEQVSSWPELYPTETLRQMKVDSIATNSLSKFTREYECRLVNPEACAFRPEWLKFIDRAPEGGMSVLAIDPVPPPSEASMKKNFQGKDYESQRVWRRVKGDYYCVEWRRNRGHEPNWSVTTAFELAIKHRVSRIVVESVAYQRVLKWLLEKEMRRRGIYFVIVDYVDKRSKYARITTTLSGVASQGHLWVSPSDSEFVVQFSSYGSPGLDHDDELDCSAIALSELVNPYLELGGDEFYEMDDEIPQLRQRRGCP
jgi:phage terminase large subunit-like protein